MNTRRIYAVFLRQLFILRGSYIRIVPLFLWAALDVVLWGFITRYLDGLGAGGFSFVPVLLGAVVLWDFLSRAQQGVTMPFLEDVWSKNFLNFFGSPLRVSEYLSGFVLSAIVTTAAGMSVVLLLARVAFGLSVFSLGILLIPYIFILFVFGVALGIFGAAIVFRFGPSAEWLIWPIPTVLSPFVGVFYPVATLPHWMQVVSQLLPPSYVFEGMRNVLLHKQISPVALSEGLGLTALWLLLAGAFFVYVYRFVLRNGLLARFEAEGP